MSEGAPAKQRDRASTLSCCLWMTGIYIGSKSVNQTIVTHSYFLFGDGPTPTQHTPSLLCSTAEGLVPLTREPRSGQHLQPHSRREQITLSQHSTALVQVQRPSGRRPPSGRRRRGIISHPRRPLLRHLPLTAAGPPLGLPSSTFLSIWHLSPPFPFHWIGR